MEQDRPRPNRAARVHALTRGGAGEPTPEEAYSEAQREAPRLSTELVEWLEKIVPDRAPTVAELANPVQLAARLGCVELVRSIRAIYNEQVRA